MTPTAIKKPSNIGLALRILAATMITAKPTIKIISLIKVAVEIVNNKDKKEMKEIAK